MQLVLTAHLKTRVTDFAVSLAHELALADRELADADWLAAQLATERLPGLSPSYQAGLETSSGGSLIVVETRLTMGGLLASLGALELVSTARAKTELE